LPASLGQPPAPGNQRAAKSESVAKAFIRRSGRRPTALSRIHVSRAAAIRDQSKMVPWPDLKGVRNILIYNDYFSHARRHTNKYTNK
jgi:hypothetical protein